MRCWACSARWSASVDRGTVRDCLLRRRRAQGRRWGARVGSRTDRPARPCSAGRPRPGRGGRRGGQAATASARRAARREMLPQRIGSPPKRDPWTRLHVPSRHGTGSTERARGRRRTAGAVRPRAHRAGASRPEPASTRGRRGQGLGWTAGESPRTDPRRPTGPRRNCGRQPTSRYCFVIDTSSRPVGSVSEVASRSRARRSICAGRIVGTWSGPVNVVRDTGRDSRGVDPARAAHRKGGRHVDRRSAPAISVDEMSRHVPGVDLSTALPRPERQRRRSGCPRALPARAPVLGDLRRGNHDPAGSSAPSSRCRWTADGSAGGRCARACGVTRRTSRGAEHDREGVAPR